MPRMTKNPKERREEFLSTAAALFASQGFARTMVSDIVNALGVAQGTFYYYFKSKEDIFLAIFERQMEKSAEKLWPLVKDGSRGAVLKLNTLIASLLTGDTWKFDDPLLKELHTSENTSLHQKITASTVKMLAPLFAALIEEGVREEVFQTAYPQEAAEFALTGALFWLDPQVFAWSGSEMAARRKALPAILEQMLGAPAGTVTVPTGQARWKPQP